VFQTLGVFAESERDCGRRRVEDSCPAKIKAAHAMRAKGVGVLKIAFEVGRGKWRLFRSLFFAIWAMRLSSVVCFLRDRFENADCDMPIFASPFWANMIHALDVDKPEPWPDGQDRQKD
jgi:hypothetical protein